MSDELNWLKDIGIAGAIIIVFGRVMFQLVQAAIAFYQGIREDNKERNSHFGQLLEINEKIADQMALTRQAIQQSSQVSSQQNEAIRLGTAVVSAMQEDVTEGFEAVQSELSNQLQPLSVSLQAITREVTGLHSHLADEGTAFGVQLADTAKILLDDITEKLDDTQGAVARTMATQMLPVLNRLDTLAEQIVQTRQEIVTTLRQVVKDDLPVDTGQR